MHRFVSFSGEADYEFERSREITHPPRLGLAGVSLGVVGDGEYGVGLQEPLWANMILGVMVRFRQFGGANPYGEGSIGAYVKAPYMGLSNSAGEEENPSEETSPEPWFDYERVVVEEGNLDVAEGIL